MYAITRAGHADVIPALATMPECDLMSRHGIHSPSAISTSPATTSYMTRSFPLASTYMLHLILPRTASAADGAEIRDTRPFMGRDLEPGPVDGSGPIASLVRMLRGQREAEYLRTADPADHSRADDSLEFDSVDEFHDMVVSPLPRRQFGVRVGSRLTLQPDSREEGDASPAIPMNRVACRKRRRQGKGSGGEYNRRGNPRPGGACLPVEIVRGALARGRGKGKCRRRTPPIIRP